ncbi:hypothetical protein LEMLEM_LOCUS25275, partial [Lemmus lemmus]
MDDQAFIEDRSKDAAASMGDVAFLGPQLWALMAWPNIGWLEILKEGLPCWGKGEAMGLWGCGATGTSPPLALFRSLPLLKGPFCEAPVRQEPPPAWCPVLLSAPLGLAA